MRIRFAGATDVGRSRSNNEDGFLVSRREPFCAVADGMGGHSAGEVASALALDVLRAEYDGADCEVVRRRQAEGPIAWPFPRRSPGHAEESRLVQAVVMANDIVYRAAVGAAGRRGMGTTLVAARFIERGLYLCHVGDSRAYRLRGTGFERLTRDHSLADAYLELGLMTREEIGDFVYRSVITQGIGLAPVVRPTVAFVDLCVGDRFLLCSDGLTDPLDDGAIGAILGGAHDLERCCHGLLAAANAAGGPDNVTVVVAEVVD